jgi:Holliday junction resolvase RusA-like endonuclease
MVTIGIFKMPYEPQASVNHMHGRGKDGKGTYLKPKASAWKKHLTSLVSDWVRTNGVTVGSKAVTIDLVAAFPPMGGKRGRKPDASNFIKLANDAISEALKVDDWRFGGSYKSGTENADDPHLLYMVEIQ